MCKIKSNKIAASSTLPKFNNNVDEKKLKTNLKMKVSEKFWECFSLKANSCFIMSTKINRKSIAPIHGKREYF